MLFRSAPTAPPPKRPFLSTREIASVFRRIARIRLGNCIGISKDRTYPVGGSHRYFEESHVPSRRGVLNTPHSAGSKRTNTDLFFEPSYVLGWKIASVFRRIACTRLGNCIGISKDHTYSVVGAYRIRPTIRHRRWRIQIYFLNPHTYSVGELHRYFEGSHVPGCRGVLHTPHTAGSKRTETGQFFEGPHVPSWRIASVFRRIARTQP